MSTSTTITVYKPFSAKEIYQVKISTKVSKLGASIPSINLPPVFTCRADAPCAKCVAEGGGCYALKGNWRYACVQNRLWDNLYAYRQNPKQFFDDIASQTRLFKFARWHSSGDIVDMEYLKGMCRVARKNKETKYLAFTKKFELVNEFLASGSKIPNNLKIVFSAWGEFIPENPYNLPMTFVEFNKTNVNKEANKLIPTDAFPCGGKCDTCTACWQLKKGQVVMFKKH